VVVVYDSLGELGGVAALLLGEALRASTVFNLCGGIINYYNQASGLPNIGTGAWEASGGALPAFRSGRMGW
jgi:hypothetical protein